MSICTRLTYLSGSAVVGSIALFNGAMSTVLGSIALECLSNNQMIENLRPRVAQQRAENLARGSAEVFPINFVAAALTSHCPDTYSELARTALITTVAAGTASYLAYKAISRSKN